ncbi:MAG TPA: amidohydrolase family protein [Anaerolineae bacterium]|nr:amidohydrolase family protein [Anaerolineae bacterium]
MIDAFAHLYPPAYMQRLQALPVRLPIFVHAAPSHTDANFRIGELDRYEIEMQAIALGTPSYDELYTQEQIAQAAELTCIGNDGIAEAVAHYPHRLIGVATLPLVDSENIEPAMEELERAVKQLQFKAVQLYTRVGDKGLDDARFAPLLERIVEYDIPILLHPTGGADNPLAREYMLWLTFGWPFETSLVMLRLVYSGVMEKFPQLKILTHHIGAFIPLMAERIKGVTFTLDKAEGTQQVGSVLPILKRFYGDTAVNGYMPALRAGYEFFGGEHVLFGTDYPFVPIAPQRESIVNWELPEQDKLNIMDANARKLFKI